MEGFFAGGGTLKQKCLIFSGMDAFSQAPLPRNYGGKEPARRDPHAESHAQFGSRLARVPSWHPEEILTKINDTHLKTPVKDYRAALITAGACLPGHQMMIVRNREDINVIGKVQQTKIRDKRGERERNISKASPRMQRD